MKRNNKKTTTKTCEQQVHHTVIADPFFKKKDNIYLRFPIDQGKHQKLRRGVASFYFSPFFAPFFNFSIPLLPSHSQVNIFNIEHSLTDSRNNEFIYPK